MSSQLTGSQPLSIWKKLPDSLIIHKQKLEGKINNENKLDTFSQTESSSI